MKHITLDEYKELLNKHDWYYAFSDDYRVFKKGEHEERKLIVMAKELGEEYLQAYFDIVKEKHDI